MAGASDDGGFTDRVQGRLDRLGLTAEDAGRAAGLPPDLIGKLLARHAPPPLLRAYRRLDFSTKAALLQVVLRMSPEPEVPERKPRQAK